MDAIVSSHDRVNVETHAWLISFSGTPPADEAVFTTVSEPEHLVATARPIELEAAFADDEMVKEVQPKPSWWRWNGTSREVRRERPLKLIWVPLEAKDSQAAEIQVERMCTANGVASRQGIVRAGIRTSRVFWSDSRAIVFAAAAQSADVIDAVLRFTVAARRTASVEKEMNEFWSSLDAHKSLVHALSERDQRMQKVINQMTERAMAMRSMHLRLTKALEQLDSPATSASKRLYAELVLHAGLYDRLEVIEEPIQFALDQYELTNTRLIEANTARREIRLETLVVLLLASEIIIFLLSLYGLPTLGQ